MLSASITQIKSDGREQSLAACLAMAVNVPLVDAELARIQNKEHGLEVLAMRNGVVLKLKTGEKIKSDTVYIADVKYYDGYQFVLIDTRANKIYNPQEGSEVDYAEIESKRIGCLVECIPFDEPVRAVPAP